MPGSVFPKKIRPETSTFSKKGSLTLPVREGGRFADNNRGLWLKPALLAKLKTAILLTKNRKVLVSQCYATGVALRNCESGKMGK